MKRSELREKPAGTIRITASPHPAETLLWPAIEGLRSDYPDIKVDISLDSTFTDIVAARSHPPCLHQSAPADPGRIAELGIREGETDLECARRWPTGVQRNEYDSEGCACRRGFGLCTGR